MKIVIASGKGGTGKTTVSVNLALAGGGRGEVQLLDCDVEEPNVHIFLSGVAEDTKEVNILLPEIIEARCTAGEGCRECADFCEFNAITCMGKTPSIAADLCHGCGGCRRACPKKAIREVPHRIGIVETLRRGSMTIVQGKMDIGMSMASIVINGVKEEIKKDGLAIIDAPPGTSCPVVSTMRDADFVVLVTEPTPFGLNDLRLAVALARELKRPFGVVVNRAAESYGIVEDYCAEEGIEVLARIPEDRRIAENYAKGAAMLEALPEYLPMFETLLANITRRTQA